MAIVYIIILIIPVVVLVVNWLAAGKFEQIAGEKGYAGYFWWCFFLGLAGWIMVAALPYKKGASRPGKKAASLPEKDDAPQLSKEASALAATLSSSDLDQTTEQLNRLSNLHDQGAISDKEYEMILTDSKLWNP